MQKLWMISCLQFFCLFCNMTVFLDIKIWSIVRHSMNNLTVIIFYVLFKFNLGGSSELLIETSFLINFLRLPCETTPRLGWVE